MTVEQENDSVANLEDFKRLLDFEGVKGPVAVEQLEKLIEFQLKGIKEGVRPDYPRGLIASLRSHWRGQVWNAWKQKNGLHRDDLYGSGRSLHTRKNSNHTTLSRRKYKPIR